MMTNSDIKDDLYRFCGTKSSTSRADIVAAVAGAIRRAQETFEHGDWSFLEQLTDTVNIPLSAPYSTGTLTATQDSKDITGSGTTWTRDMEGSFIQINGGEFYEIRTFTSTTALILNIPFQGTTGSSLTYVIYKRFYPLPLNFSKPIGTDAKLITPGNNGSSVINYHRDASFVDDIVDGAPLWFGIVGNIRRADYYNTGTVTVSSTTWTGSGTTFPTDIVDREIRIHGESRGYRVFSRTSGTVLVTYDAYVNPSDLTGVQGTASTYAITPKETQLVGLSPIPDQRYILSLPYLRRMEDMLLSADISPIIQAGYERAFVALCRKILAEDKRIAMKGDDVRSLQMASEEAMADAWTNEVKKATLSQQGTIRKVDRRPIGPSWIAR